VLVPPRLELAPLPDGEIRFRFVVPVPVPPRLMLLAPTVGEVVVPVPTVAPVGVVVPTETPVELLLIGFTAGLREAGLVEEPDVTGVTPVGVTDIALAVPIVPSELFIPLVLGVEELEDVPGVPDEVTGLVGELR